MRHGRQRMDGLWGRGGGASPASPASPKRLAGGSPSIGRGRCLVLLLYLLGGVVARAGDVPFMEPFDNLSTGVLQSQNAWESRRQRDVQVQTTVKFDGTKAAVVATNALLWNNFGDPTVTNVWIDYYGRQAYPPDDTPPALAGSVAAAFYIDSGGALRVTSNATWLVLGVTVPSNTWRRYTINLDYLAERWSLFMASEVPNALSTAVITNVPFWSGSTNTYFQAFRVKN